MKILIYIAVFCAVLSAIWAFFIEPNLLKIKNYKISCSELQGIKIVYAGDFHIAPEHKKRLQKIIKEINNQNPDLVLLGGDYVKGHKAKSSMPIRDIAAELKKITSKHGIFGVMGNHDWYVDGTEIIAALKDNNIKILQNENTSVKIDGKELCIAGIEDMYTRQPDLKKALSSCKDSVILLSHEPDIYPDVPEDVCLTLAGHMHGGQVRLPFIGALIVPSPMGPKYAQGYFEEKGRKMIVSSGLGTSLLPLRFNTFPEIVVIEFE